MSSSAPSPRILALTVVTMVFFAANSVLGRLALRAGEIDGAGYTAVRILSGAAILIVLVGWKPTREQGSWKAAFAMFAYAITFSYAYGLVEAGAGALILFAAVQISMISLGMLRGERPGGAEWTGLLVSLGGLAYLLSPGLTAPSPLGAALMASSGAAWGVYSLAARGVASPIAATAGNFVRASPLAVGAGLLAWSVGASRFGSTGLLLAVISGAITSGLGYVLWYTALRGLTATRAAVVQLTVPLIAAGAGVAFLGERLTGRLALSAAVILGGVGLALAGRRVASPRPTSE